MIDLMHGDCIEKMRELGDNSVDSIVTDPPYGLGFMGKKWDALPPSLEVFEECLRVLKPGGHLLAFGGSRTYHRLAVAVEDAGFDIRDQIMWVYGQGFPKSQNVGKAIDKAAGAEREVIGHYESPEGTTGWRGQNKTGAVDFGASRFEDGERRPVTAPTTDAARQWEGWGTALKPAHEPIVMARKPLAGTVAANVMEYGTGAINVDGCRVGTDESTQRPCGPDSDHAGQFRGTQGGTRGATAGTGRFPANLIHDGSDEVVGLFPSSVARPVKPENIGKSGDGAKRGLFGSGSIVQSSYYDTETSAARFFYCAKAGKKDRGEGNKHPTVKPTELMRYLCRLVTPPGGVVLDPFMGSGSTGKAAMLEGFEFIGIELDPDYFAIAENRIQEAGQQVTPKTRLPATA